jgi:hypothetical protein
MKLHVVMAKYKSRDHTTPHGQSIQSKSTHVQTKKNQVKVNKSKNELDEKNVKMKPQKKEGH